jgi:hypothetical protein
MKNSRWQFSLRTLLLVMAAVAVVVALVANAPEAAVAILVCILWILLESGILMHITLGPILRQLFRIPYSRVIVAGAFGTFSLLVAGLLVCLAVRNYSTFRIVAGAAFFAALLAGFAYLCFSAAWILRDEPMRGEVEVQKRPRKLHPKR